MKIESHSPLGQGLRTTGMFLLLTLLVFLARSYWTWPIGHSDLIRKMRFAAQIVASGDWTILLTDHHSLRWPAMLLQIAALEIFGHRYELYQAIPLAVFAMLCSLIVLYLRDVVRWPALILLTALLFIDPWWLYVSNEFLITGLGVLFAFGGACVLAGGGRPAYWRSLLAALLFFCAYGSQVMYLSFALGAGLWLLVLKRDWRNAIVFGVGLFILFLLETLFFNWLSGWTLNLGRIQSLSGGPHLELMGGFRPTPPSRLFTRWLDLPGPSVLCAVVFLMTGLWAWLAGRIRTIPDRLVIVYLMGLSFALSVTLGLYSIDPLRPIVPLRVRYLLPFLPFAYVVAVPALYGLATKFTPRIPPRAHIITALVMAALMLALALSEPRYRHRSKGFYWRANTEYSRFAEDFAGGKVVLQGKRRGILRSLATFQNDTEHGVTSDGGYMSPPLDPDHLCMWDMRQTPIELNYEPCDRDTP